MALRALLRIGTDRLPPRIIQRWIGPRLVVAKVKPPVPIQGNRTRSWILQVQRFAQAQASQQLLAQGICTATLVRKINPC